MQFVSDTVDNKSSEQHSQARPSYRCQSEIVTWEFQFCPVLNPDIGREKALNRTRKLALRIVARECVYYLIMLLNTASPSHNSIVLTLNLLNMWFAVPFTNPLS